MSQQLTAEDVHRLYTERRYGDIVEAHKAGHLRRLLGVPEDQIALLDRATTGMLGRRDLTRLQRLGRHDLIEHARLAGRITDE
jgi:hypothetical protein